MGLGEFELIARHFQRARHSHARTLLGIGDDAALIKPSPGKALVVSTDMLVEGRHFLPTVDPAALGHKALAVNLSDLAAMGATPLAFTLALSMPRAEVAFLAPFAQGLFALADAHGIELVGGDTTAGPLNLCITVMGEVNASLALRRGAARVGDDVWVSHPTAGQGGVGDARLALEVFRGKVHLDAKAFKSVRERMERPEPRVALGQALLGVAHAAIDVSDGLLGDLMHVLKASGVGAALAVDDVPTSAVLRKQPLSLRRLCTLTGGDDYELVFTAATRQRRAVKAAAKQAGVEVTRIGSIEAKPGLRLLDARQRAVVHRPKAFDHFAEPTPDELT